MFVSSLAKYSNFMMVRLFNSYNSPKIKMSENIQNFSKRHFSSYEKIPRLIGPAPSQPILPGEPNFDLVTENMQLYLSYKKPTILSHEEIEKLRSLQPSSPLEVSPIQALFDEMKITQSLIQKINLNFQKIVEIINHPKT